MPNVILLVGSEREKRVALAETALTIMQQSYQGLASIVAASEPIPDDVERNAIMAAGQLVERANTAVKICREPDSLVLLCDWFTSSDLFGDKLGEGLRSLCVTAMDDRAEFKVDAILSIDENFSTPYGWMGDAAEIGYDPRGLAIVLAYMVGMDLDGIRH